MNSKLVYLVQTDTTVGFSSEDDGKLSSIKKRLSSQKILQTVDSFQTLKKNTRIPNKHKKLVRNSKKTTFIYPNSFSYRVVDRTSVFFDFINKFNILYSTSANETKKKFDLHFAENNVDVIVENKKSYFETNSSKIMKINKSKKVRLR